jgi:hypothetical protein
VGSGASVHRPGFPVGRGMERARLPALRREPMRTPRAAVVGAALGVLMPSVGACQSSATPTALPASEATTAPSPSVSVSVTSPTTNPTPSPTTTRPAPRPRVILLGIATKPAPPKPAPPRCRVPSGVTSRQVVLVDAWGSGATIRACERPGSRYTLALGPFDGHVGRNGVSWNKREGDRRTPAGVFPLRNGFGVYRNPGLGAVPGSGSIPTTARGTTPNQRSTTPTSARPPTAGGTALNSCSCLPRTTTRR